MLLRSGKWKDEVRHNENNVMQGYRVMGRLQVVLQWKQMAEDAHLTPNDLLRGIANLRETKTLMFSWCLLDSKIWITWFEDGTDSFAWRCLWMWHDIVYKIILCRYRRLLVGQPTASWTIHRCLSLGGCDFFYILLIVLSHLIKEELEYSVLLSYLLLFVLPILIYKLKKFMKHLF